MTSLPSKNQNAFTVIELLITVMIMIITLTIGVINYLRFLEKQNLYRSGADIEAILKDAHSKAQNGFLGNEEIGFCDKLAAVEVLSGVTAENKVFVTAELLCADDSVLIYENYIVDHDEVVFDQNFQISFLPLRGATLLIGGTQVANGNVILSHENLSIDFSFDQGGTINVSYE